jgi:hypothetical protein
VTLTLKATERRFTMPDNKDADQKKPGEKTPGKFHFNPGNMSGKTVKVGKDQSEENQKTRDGQRDKKR